MDLTHFDQDGNAWMVDVSDKDITTRMPWQKALLLLMMQFMNALQREQ